MSPEEKTSSRANMMVVDGVGLQLVPWDVASHMLLQLVSYFFTFFIVVGGAIPYVFQYAEIYQRKDARGFSLFVCLALCVANILRVLFWFGKRFDLALLAQSVVMFTAMIFMLELSVRMNKKHTSKAHQKSLLRGDVLSGFWGWHDLTSFLIALGIFTVFWSFTTMMLIGYTWYVETLGMASLLVEASLGMPQLIRNFQRKCTSGMSINMVLMWLLGDLAKTGYFVATGSPKQFWVCAILQISIDISILGQVVAYRKNHPSTASLPYTDASPAHTEID